MSEYEIDSAKNFFGAVFGVIAGVYLYFCAIPVDDSFDIASCFLLCSITIPLCFFPLRFLSYCLIMLYLFVREQQKRKQLGDEYITPLKKFDLDTLKGTYWLTDYSIVCSDGRAFSSVEDGYGDLCVDVVCNRFDLKISVKYTKDNKVICNKEIKIFEHLLKYNDYDVYGRYYCEVRLDRAPFCGTAISGKLTFSKTSDKYE